MLIITIEWVAGMNIEWLKSMLDAIGVTKKLNDTQALLSVDGNITEAQLLTTIPSQLGGVYMLSDGANRGAKLTWAVPSGASSPTWCWWLWPQAAYEG